MPAGPIASPAAARRYARVIAALAGFRWAHAQYSALGRTLGPDGLNAEVAPPPTVARGSLRGAQAFLELRRATCLERSLIIQAWFAANGAALDVIIGVRRTHVQGGAQAHAWVDRYDADCSKDFAEIRRVSARLVASRRTP